MLLTYTATLLPSPSLDNNYQSILNDLPQQEGEWKSAQPESAQKFGRLESIHQPTPPEWKSGQSESTRKSDRLESVQKQPTMLDGLTQQEGEWKSDWKSQEPTTAMPSSPSKLVTATVWTTTLLLLLAASGFVIVLR